jgi:hypothetical protein
MKTDTHSEFTVDDLPRFSPWPARLLGLTPWQPRKKTASEVTREFDRDKWGALLERYRAAGGTATLDTVEEWWLENEPAGLCSIGNRLELLPAKQALARHVQLVAATLQRFLPVTSIVELGAGYGSVILRLAADTRFRGIAMSAAEYTGSGVALIELLAAAQHSGLQAGRCDLSADPFTDLAIPAGSIVFTCMAAHYIAELDAAFVETFRLLKPQLVVHFEPCYEHCDVDTLIGALRRRYIEVNDYNRNLVSLLHSHVARGDLRILEETPAAMGVNPLLPVSVIAWQPLEAR